MVYQRKVKLVVKKRKELAENFFEMRMGVNMQIGFSSQKVKCRNQSWKSKDVITMKMRDKDMVKPAKLGFVFL